VALALGLQSAAQGGVAGVAEASVSALAKVVQVMPPRLRGRVEALRAMTVAAGWAAAAPGPVVDAGVLTTVAQGCRDAVRLRFTYTAADGARSDREVEPARLALLGRRWYLVAYDLGRHDWRSFRLDRLSAPAATGVRFRPRELPAEDAADFVRRSVRRLPETHEIELIVQAPADVVEGRLGAWSRVQAVDATSCRMTMHADQFGWPVLGLAQLDAEFTVVRPPEFAAYLAALAARFARAQGRPAERER
jgi:predicted DNA-binding transcriptional regulator YafY